MCGKFKEGGVIILYEDYTKTGKLYHVVNINDLSKTLEEGIGFNDKNTYLSKYLDFHSYFDQNKTPGIPAWVERKRAIFASMNFKDGHKWHSHTALLEIKTDESKCWICNENIANFIYEPFILQNMRQFAAAKKFLEENGKDIVADYWRNSLSFEDNLRIRNDKKEGYDAEVLIMHHIPPESIKCVCIISDHQNMTYRQWKEFFNDYSSKCLQAQSTYSDWNMSASQ